MHHFNLNTINYFVRDTHLFKIINHGWPISCNIKSTLHLFLSDRAVSLFVLPCIFLFIIFGLIERGGGLKTMEICGRFDD